MITLDMVKAGYEAGLINLVDGRRYSGDGVVCSIGDNWFYFGGQTAEEYTDVEKYKSDIPKGDIIQSIFEVLEQFSTADGFEDEYLYYESVLRENGILPGFEKNDSVSLWGRLGVQIDLTPEEFEILKQNDKAAKELLISLVQSDRCFLYGESYFPPEPNEEYIFDSLEFDVDYQPLQKAQYIEKDERMFIFDDELCFGQDEGCETVDGYLWATDVLVERMKDVVKDNHSPEILDTFDNINFYSIYNVRTGTVKIEGTYYFDDGNGEKQGEFELPLSEDEKKELISSLELYCNNLHSKTCIECINEFRRDDNLPEIRSCTEHIPLCEQIHIAGKLKDKNVNLENPSNSKSNYER